MTGMSLSAVVPNFNHARFISEAVAALAAQGPAPDEIVVVDDGSTDDSLAVLEALRHDHPTCGSLRSAGTAVRSGG